MMKKSNIFEINQELSGQRLDNFLIKKLKGLPKSLIYKLVRSGQVRVNKKRSKVSYRISDNDFIRIPPHLIQENVIADKILLNTSEYIHYENENFMLLNKPYGISVHSGTNQEVDFLSSLRKSQNNNDLSLVHRLDKNTSGCLLVSKNYQVASALGKELMNKNIRKKYYALLIGVLDKEIIEIESKIEKNTKHQKMIVNENDGREAYTKITLLQKYKSFSFVEIEIETGRTHQIRVHTSSIGHPVVGDSKYEILNSKMINKELNLKRLFLHAYYLSFYYGKKYEFILDLPDDLKEVLSTVEKDNE
jgi:23S rRNA pseudouridine955/2504/2580 synthase